MSSRSWPICAIAAVWGFGEATLFFILPDVYLSWVALADPRRSVIAVIVALTGALIGGALMYAWGRNDPAGAILALDRVPAISDAMIARVSRELEAGGLGAVFLGPTRGTPYKIYAVQSGALGISFPSFLAVSVPARLVRFALVTGLAAWVSQRPLAGRSLTVKRWIHAGAWTAVYAVYFSIFL